MEVWLWRPPRLGIDCWVESPAYLAPPDLGCSPQGVLQRQPTALLGSAVTGLPGAAAGALPPLIGQSTGFYWAPPSYGVVSGAGDEEVMETGAAWTVSELTALRRGRGRREERLDTQQGKQCVPNKGIHLVCVSTCGAEGSSAGSFPRGGQEEGAGQVPRRGVPGGEELGPGAAETSGRASQQYGFYSKWKLLSRKLAGPGFIWRGLP